MSGTVSKLGQKFMMEEMIGPIGDDIATVLLSKCDVSLKFSFKYLNLYP